MTLRKNTNYVYVEGVSACDEAPGGLFCTDTTPGGGAGDPPPPPGDSGEPPPGPTPGCWNQIALSYPICIRYDPADDRVCLEWTVYTVTEEVCP